MAVSGPALAAIAAGAVFTYSGLTGKSTLAIVQAAIRGTGPAGVPQSAPIVAADPVAQTGSASGAETPEGASPAGSAGALATDALQYKGAGYVFGGAPARGVGHWDCSSFMNYIIGMRAKLPIPGYKAGAYHGTSHGPTAIMWYAWTGAVTISHDGKDAQPGDLCCWQTHIGMAIGGGQMISARSARDHPPTGINTINGAIRGERLAIRRLKVT